MSDNAIALLIDRIVVDNQKPETILAQVVTNLGESLKCDRVFLYLRDPDRRLGKVPFCWCKDESIPDVTSDKLERESPQLEQQDPLFAAALDGQPSVFIEDVETASAETVNHQFERENFGHQALIHAHLYQDQLWGVLQPCVFSQPRQWTESEQKAIESIVQQITPIAMGYVKNSIQPLATHF